MNGSKQHGGMHLRDGLTAEVLAVGTELVSGRILDTNSHWLCGQMAALGCTPRRVAVVPDDVCEVADALNDALERRCGLVVCTGGLGPTPDDVTTEALAAVAGVRTEVHEPTIREYMARRGIERREDVTPNLVRMATVPCGAEVLPNPAGWAPCIKLTLGPSTVFALPGPPREVEAIFREYVAPFIASRCGYRCVAARLGVAMYESEVSPLIEEVMQAFPGTYLKAYVALRRPGEDLLPVDVVARAGDEADAAALLEKAVGRFCELASSRGRCVKRCEG